MARCLIGLGANLADRRATLERAVQRLSSDPALHVVARSGWRETQAAGGPPDQPAFLNGALLIDTSLKPEELLATLIRVEDALGRVRTQRWGPRTIDLDLLLYDQLVLESPRLVLPHPRMSFRRFVLAPAAEIAPEMLHPTVGWTIQQLHDHMVRALPYVALAGSIGLATTEVAALVARDARARLLCDAADADQLAAVCADPAGRGWQTAIEFLDRRKQLLDRAQWPATGGPSSVASDPWPMARGQSSVVHEAKSDEPPALQWTVSDFWFDQTWAYAQVWLDEPQRAAFERLWQQGRASVVPPKLLVVFDKAPQAQADPVAQCGRRDEHAIGEKSGERRLAELHESFMEVAARPGLGPVLRLAGLDAFQAAAEVTAAMQAMQ